MSTSSIGRSDVVATVTGVSSSPQPRIGASKITSDVFHASPVIVPLSVVILAPFTVFARATHIVDMGDVEELTPGFWRTLIRGLCCCTQGRSPRITSNTRYIRDGELG